MKHKQAVRVRTGPSHRKGETSEEGHLKRRRTSGGGERILRKMVMVKREDICHWVCSWCFLHELFSMLLPFCSPPPPYPLFFVVYPSAPLPLCTGKQALLRLRQARRLHSGTSFGVCSMTGCDVTRQLFQHATALHTPTLLRSLSSDELVKHCPCLPSTRSCSQPHDLHQIYFMTF